MKQIISVQIDVTKIDKKRLYQGKKGNYLNAIVVLGEEDQYGNHGFISESVSKEEREQGVKGTILGNVKILSETKSKAPEQEIDNSFDDMSDDLPFVWLAPLLMFLL